MCNIKIANLDSYDTAGRIPDERKPTDLNNKYYIITIIAAIVIGQFDYILSIGLGFLI